MANPSHDLLIVGAGPAGLALAAEAQALGLDVGIVDPTLDRPWTQTWCVFEDEAPDVPVRRRWETLAVRLPSGHRRQERAYLEVDGPALQARLRGATADCTGHATVARRLEGNRLHTRDGVLQARFVVDCSGARQVLGRRGPAPTAYQTAYGLEIETDGHPWAVDEVLWMDLTGMEQRPSFLYVLPSSPTRVFVEETALAARPELPVPELRERLLQRLARLGVEVLAVHREERCRIALDVPAPAGLAFGTAAGMVHPATGYLLARALQAAPRFAAALAAGDADGAMATTRSPTRALHRYGLDVLTSCDGPELTAFFEAFFSQPTWATRAFLASSPRLPDTVLSMSRLFLSTPVRSLLVRPASRFGKPVETACPPS